MDFFLNIGLPVRLNMVICYCIMGRPPHTNLFITIKFLRQPNWVNGRGDDSEKWGRKNLCLDALGVGGCVVMLVVDCHILSL